MKENFKRYIVEFIGTFFLVFTIGCTALLNGGVVIPAIAIGFMLMVMVYAGGHISGAHYNPAVSLSASVRGALEWKELLPYWIVQVLGAVCAGFLVRYVGVVPAEADAIVFNIPTLIICEFLFTFALCYVVLLTATSKKCEGNSYFGLAIGSTVTVGAFAVGGIVCAGAFNPAVAISLFVMGISSLKVIGIT
ncbi:aquaporin, partial [bacterium]|nr:aquaporin [bacterium]